MVMPGDDVEIAVQLGAPIAMEEGLRFAIREGGRTVGSRQRRESHRVTVWTTPWPKTEDNRPKITLACTECKRRNYNTVKNRINDRDRGRSEEVLPLVPDAHPAPRDALGGYPRLARADPRGLRQGPHEHREQPQRADRQHRRGPRRPGREGPDPLGERRARTSPERAGDRPERGRVHRHGAGQDGDRRVAAPPAQRQRHPLAHHHRGAGQAGEEVAALDGGRAAGRRVRAVPLRAGVGRRA